MPISNPHGRAVVLQQSINVHGCAFASLRGRLCWWLRLLHPQVRVNLEQQPLGPLRGESLGERPRCGVAPATLRSTATEQTIHIRGICHGHGSTGGVQGVRARSHAQNCQRAPLAAVCCGCCAGSRKDVQEMAKEHDLARRVLERSKEDVGVERWDRDLGIQLGRWPAQRSRAPSDRAMALHGLDWADARLGPTLQIWHLL
mmetsp:Transcript_28006/g.65390  ORF Transcript_28006/g.65390 Transcript_28006/m.65390 type:complete len:201 (-) Transcript_28006:1360-1962(-)